jgi:hypothetical protein
VWADSDADVLVYMDVDLSTDLNALLPLVAAADLRPLRPGHRQPAAARLAGRRGPKREVISRGYNLLVKGALRTRFSDAQCGFKAIRRDVAREVLPLVEDDAWFFDTELLVLAERAGLRIHEVPVDWVDDPDSRVDLLRTATDDVAASPGSAGNLVSGRLPVAEVSERLGRARPPDAGRAGSGMQVAHVRPGRRRVDGWPYAVRLPAAARLGPGAWAPTLLALLLTADRQYRGRTAGSPSGCAAGTTPCRHQLQGLARLRDRPSASPAGRCGGCTPPAAPPRRRGRGADARNLGVTVMRSWR